MLLPPLKLLALVSLLKVVLLLAAASAGASAGAAAGAAAGAVGPDASTAALFGPRWAARAASALIFL